MCVRGEGWGLLEHSTGITFLEKRLKNPLCLHEQPMVSVW